MPIQKLLCSTLVLLLSANTILANGIFRRIPDGVIVCPDSRFSGHTAAVRLITTYTTEFSLHSVTTVGDIRLRLDRWRQAWNPGSAVPTLPMEKDTQPKIALIY